VAFNLTFRYIDDVLSINNNHFHTCQFDISQWAGNQRHHSSQLIRYARACSTYDQFLIRGSLLTEKVDVTGVSTVSFTGSFPQVLWSLQRSSLLILPFFRTNAVWFVSYQSLSRFLIHWFWLQLKPFTWNGIGAHGGCDRSTGDAYSSYSPDPTSGIQRSVFALFSGLYFLQVLWDW
jgi:hypothetical protein